MRKSKIIRSEGHIARMDDWSSRRSFIRTPEGKRPLARLGIGGKIILNCMKMHGVD